MNENLSGPASLSAINLNDPIRRARWEVAVDFLMDLFPGENYFKMADEYLEDNQITVPEDSPLVNQHDPLGSIFQCLKQYT